jgi:hypothetical protein
VNRVGAVVSIFLTLLILSGTHLVLANPLAMPVVNVQSPVNNQNYLTNNVELKATAYATPSSINFTINYYILDNQQSVPTNGTTVLRDLSPGSHTIKLYGTRSVFDEYINSTNYSNDELVSIVYFSVIYSTQWIIFTVILALVSGITSLVLFRKRKQIKAAIERPKRDVFFAGSVLLFFSCISTVYFAWQTANNYLFPYWPPKLFVLNSTLPFIISLFFLGLSLLLMWFGTHKK